jgi:predicted metal-binding membrane protein
MVASRPVAGARPASVRQNSTASSSVDQSPAELADVLADRRADLGGAQHVLVHRAEAVFVPVWTLMMAAMMLPSVTPAASQYARTMPSNRTARIAGLVAGYLAVWAAAGVPAFGRAWLAAGWPRACTPRPR